MNRLTRALAILLIHAPCYILGFIVGVTMTIILLMWAGCLAGYRAGRYR